MLPGCFVNLLKGLCYKNNDDYEDMKANRWTTKEVSKWLIQMKNRDYEKAATFNMVPDNISDVHNATGNGGTMEDFRNIWTPEKMGDFTVYAAEGSTVHTYVSQRNIPWKIWTE